MAIKHEAATSMKKGSYILIDATACKVSDVQISRPGKHGHAKVRIQAVGLIDGKKRDVVMPGHEVEVPIIEKRNAQILSMEGTKANVMDTETFETFDLEIPEDLQGTVTDGAIILYWDILGQKVMKQIKSAGDAGDE
ncbi:MAG: translation initiation factor IF-5A [Nanoarchaeota archaeon]|nr:translation initiation factor IF-5A [Nanoarchaeota archaeon]